MWIFVCLLEMHEFPNSTNNLAHFLLFFFIPNSSQVRDFNTLQSNYHKSSLKNSIKYHFWKINMWNFNKRFLLPGIEKQKKSWIWIEIRSKFQSLKNNCWDSIIHFAFLSFTITSNKISLNIFDISRIIFPHKYKTALKYILFTSWKILKNTIIFGV